MKSFDEKKLGDIAFLSIGTRLGDTLGAANELNNLGHSASVADARFAKPIDKKLILELVKNHNILFIVEEASSGGFCSLVTSYLANLDLINSNLKVRSFTMPDMFIEHKTQEAQIIQAGLDKSYLVKQALSLLGNKKALSIG